MLRYTPKYWFAVTMLLKKPLIRTYGKELTSHALKQGKSIYRDMLNKTDDIGADNPMASNIYISFILMAIWKAGDGAISAESLVDVATELLETPKVQKLMGKLNLNNPDDLSKLNTTLHANKQWALDHPEYLEATWDLNFDESLHRDGIFYYYTRCPIEKFARENGFIEILPVGCAMDYPSARAKHAVLHREQTLAAGGTMCDFWLVPDEIEDSE